MLRYHETKQALGSEVVLTIVSESDPKVLFTQLWKEIFAFERQFSRFLPMSELSVFNRSAGIKTAITPQFRALLLTAQRLSRETSGLYNPFVLPALQRAGYTQSFAEGYKEDTHDNFADRAVAQPDKLRIGDTWAQIPYGSALDLGGCGKGYLADLLADSMVPTWVTGYWFSFGGDIVGDGTDEDNKPWDISIYTEPSSKKSDGSWIFRSSGGRFAAATSSTQHRRGTHHGKSWHHIIDPRTQKPANSDIYQASIFMPRAVDADVFASCAIILGSKNTLALFHRNYDVSGLLLGKDQNTHHFGPSVTNVSSNKMKRAPLHA